jgi:DNA primase
VQIEEVIYFGKDRLPAGPNVNDSDAVIVVEGRSDVLNLLKSGIKNAIAVEGTNIPKTISELSKERVVTAFVDGDRGGELILRELFQVAEVDFVARAPRAHEVEELTQKQIMKCLRNKIPAEQYIEMFGLEADVAQNGPGKPRGERSEKAERLERFEREEKAERATEKPEKAEKPDRAEKPERQEKAEKPERQEKAEKPERGEREERSERPERRERQERGERSERGDRQDRSERTAKPERGDREDRTERAEKVTQAAPSEAPPERRSNKKLSEAQEKYRVLINELATTSKAKLLDSQGNVTKDVTVKELVNTLKSEADPVSAVVFDGIVTQRILDIAVEKEIGTIVGTKMGNITKQPSNVEVWVKDDLN